MLQNNLYGLKKSPHRPKASVEVKKLEKKKDEQLMKGGGSK